MAEPIKQIPRQASHEEAKKEEIKSIKQALNVLNKVIDHDADQVRAIVQKDYKKLSRVFEQSKPEYKAAFSGLKDVTKESLSDATEKVKKATKESAQKVDRSAHEHPWPYIAGAAALSALGGFFLASRFRR